MTPGYIAAFGLGLVALYAAKSSGGRPRKRKAKSPFVDKDCTELRDESVVQKWIDRVAFKRYRKAFKINPLDLGDTDKMRDEKIRSYVEYALAVMPPACQSWSALPARRRLYAMTFCTIGRDLMGRGVVADADPEYFEKGCADPNFDPLDPGYFPPGEEPYDPHEG